MGEELLVNVTPRETRAALLESGVLQEIFIEREARRGFLSNIYKGKVSRVLPGMQAAFIDIGLERTGFLHASDIMANLDGETTPPINGNGPVDIRSLVSEGSPVLVQVVKDPLGTKGARLTTSVTLPSRYLVMMPDKPTLGVSSRIDDIEERERLRSTMELLLPADCAHGFIVRTAAEGAPLEALNADMMFLTRLWEVICRDAEGGAVPRLVHDDLPLTVRVLRDLVSADIERIRVDSDSAFVRMKKFASMFLPDMEPIIEHYQSRRPIFDLYGVEDEISKALQRRVELKSGGHIVVDQTEAMTTIDVNTGGFVGTRNLEDTIYRTNLEAAVAIARQLRLRNLGGIIIIDFIDMVDAEHREQVMALLDRSMAQDHARYQILPVSNLGLVEMTRKRTRESLEHVLCTPCPTCKGSGSVRTAETVCYEIYREILRQHRQFTFDELLILAHEDVIELFLDDESAALAELEDITSKPIRLQAESLYKQHQFDVVLI
ncbi:MAG: ribonuclease G [Pseudomonadota bacterium]